MIQNLSNKKIILVMICIFSLFSMYGCSSDSGTKSGSETGDISIGLTDAQGDFLSYTVDVTSITLTHANGNVVETLPTTTRVDFAQYVDMTEFLTAASVPLGAYKAATLHLDYSNADIVVEDAEGSPLTVSSIVDADGNAVTELAVDVYLANRSSLVVSVGLPRHLALDFDLDLSNTVEFNDDTAVVTVDPTLTAIVNHDNDKPYRVRGLLEDVDTEFSYFTVDVRPFFHSMKKSHHPFGQLIVMTNDDTVFEINGESLVGEDGLLRLADVEQGSAVIAMGKMVFGEKNAITATSVYVGSSVPGCDSDYVKGSVVARNGDILTVNGMVYIKDQDLFIMHDSVVVTVGTDTFVKKQGSDDSFATDDISPAQHVTILGTVTVNETSQTPEMDATEGLVRMNETVLHGQVIAPSATDSYLTVDLASISKINADMFDFTGTGTVSPDDDAVESSYEIETGDLDISELEAGDDVKVYGFPNAFGAAPYDFLATSVVNDKDRLSCIKLNWTNGTTEPFSSITEEELVVNTDALKQFRYIKCKGPNMHDNTFTDGFTITSDDQGTFIIIIDDEMDVYSDFSEFTSALNALFDGITRAKGLFVQGTYDEANAIMKAHDMTITIQ